MLRAPAPNAAICSIRRDHDVLEEVDHLVLVGEVVWNDTAVASENRPARRDERVRKPRSAGCRLRLDGHGDGESQRGRAIHGTDHLGRRPVGTEFAEALMAKAGDQQAPAKGR